MIFLPNQGGCFIGMLALGKEIASIGFSRLIEKKHVQANRTPSPSHSFIHSHLMGLYTWNKVGQTYVKTYLEPKWPLFLLEKALYFKGSFSPMIEDIHRFQACVELQHTLDTKKTLGYFPWNPGCLLGILICHGLWYNPYITCMSSRIYIYTTYNHQVPLFSLLIFNSCFWFP